MPADPVALAELAAARLAGTAKTIAQLGPEFEAAESSQAFCDRLDTLVFNCTGCDWWFEHDEMSVTEDWVCRECADA